MKNKNDIASVPGQYFRWFCKQKTLFQEKENKALFCIQERLH